MACSHYSTACAVEVWTEQNKINVMVKLSLTVTSGGDCIWFRATWNVYECQWAVQNDYTFSTNIASHRDDTEKEDNMEQSSTLDQRGDLCQLPWLGSGTEINPAVIRSEVCDCVTYILDGRCILTQHYVHV